MVNQSMIIFLNEEGNVAALILLIRLVNFTQEAKPKKSDLEQTGDQPAGTSSSPLLLTPSSPPLHLDIIRLTEGRLHHQVTALSYLFAYKPVTINDHWSNVSRAF